MDSIIKSSIKEPFDPSSLKAEVKNTTIGALVDMLKNDLIDLNPEFQRNGNLWNDDRKSQLIESILLGLPLPSFYFYIDERQKKWVVIDGLQRLCSLKSFMVDGSLCLQGLEFLDKKKYSKKYDEFEYFDQLAMKMHPVTLNVLSGNTSADARYIIFQRVNSKGTQLTPTEMRNALYQGPATILIKQMAENELFKQLVSSQIGTTSTTRMKDREYVSRFLLFYMNDYHSYDGHLDMAINQTLDYINKEKFSQKQMDHICKEFVKALAVCNKLLGENAFRKPNSTNVEKRKNAVSLAVFEMLAVSIARLPETNAEELIERKSKFVHLYKEMFEDEILQHFLTGGTSKVPAIIYKFDKMQNVIQETLNSFQLQLPFQ